MKIFKKIIKFIARLLLLSVIAVALFVSMFLIGVYAPQIHKSMILSTTADKIFLIESTKDGKPINGTGFVIANSKGSKFILTNSHICNGNKELSVFSYEGTKYTTKVIKESVKRDLCAIAPVGNYKSLDITKNKQYQYGDILYVVGYPSTYPLHISKGTIVGGITNFYSGPVPKNGICLKGGLKVEIINKQTKEKKGLCSYAVTDTVTTVQVRGGSSGSPLLDDAGSVVGVGRDDGSWALAVNSDDIIDFIEGL